MRIAFADVFSPARNGRPSEFFRTGTDANELFSRKSRAGISTNSLSESLSPCFPTGSHAGDSLTGAEAWTRFDARSRRSRATGSRRQDSGFARKGSMAHLMGRSFGDHKGWLDPLDRAAKEDEVSRDVGRKRVLAVVGAIVATLIVSIFAAAETETQTYESVMSAGSWINADAVASPGGDFATHPPTGSFAAFYALKFALPADAIILSAKITSSGWKSGGVAGQLAFRLESGHGPAVPAYGPFLTDSQATYTTDVPPGTVAMMTAEDLRDGVWYIYMGGGWSAGVSLHVDWFTVTIEYRLPLSITGRPDKMAPLGKVYSLSPRVKGGQTPRAFSIKNKPRWLRLNAATGSLSGMPRSGDVGIYTGITITVTDSLGESASLGPFTICVRAESDQGKTGLPGKLFDLDPPDKGETAKTKDGTSGQTGNGAAGPEDKEAIQSGYRPIYKTFVVGENIRASWKLGGSATVHVSVYPVLVERLAMRILESYGKAVYERQLKLNRQCKCYEFVLPTSDLEAGLYDIVVTYAGGKERMRIILEEPAS